MLAGRAWLRLLAACSAMWVPWRRASLQQQEAGRAALQLLVLPLPQWTASCARSAAAAGAAGAQRM